MEAPVSSLPSRPNLDHLKRQAKDLLRLYRERDPEAFARIRASLPAARGRSDAAIAEMQLRLHDAQSSLAREYGCASWDELRTAVTIGRADQPHFLHRWLALAYGVAERSDQPHPALASRMLEQAPESLRRHALVACATGNERLMREMGLFDATKVADPLEWRCPDCDNVFACPPLSAVTHSSLIQLPAFAANIRRSARALLDAHADPNERWIVAGHSLSALYGAAGKNHDAELTKMLLDAGADPNDNESLYHATEARDLTCLTLLLEHDAKIQGTNALHHQLDRDGVTGLSLLLAHGADPNDPQNRLGPPLLWAIRRRRSPAHARALLDAGANPHVRNWLGESAYVLAERYGLAEVADLLRQRGAGEPLSLADQFVAACARADGAAARHILDRSPDVIQALSPAQLRQLPNLAAAGDNDGVRLMAELGWPIAVTGGDWKASALNLAVFLGDSALTRFLLDHGASWAERHGYGDNATGTLSWASRNRPSANGDWVGCAEALVDHGMPIPPESEAFSDEVADVLDERRSITPASS
jgi:ankyrin repeat protein